MASKCNTWDRQWTADRWNFAGCLGSLEFLELVAFDAVDGHSHLHIFLVFFAPGWWLAAGQESPQSSSWILKQKHTKTSSRKTDWVLASKVRRWEGEVCIRWSPPVKGADSFLQIQRGCCVHATCWHAELHRFKVDSTSHAGSGGRLHQMRIPLDK